MLTWAEKLIRIGIPIVVLVVVPIVVMGTATSATAQITGAIEGVVEDAGGAVLPGVTVVATSPALLRGSVTVTTDETGSFRVPALQAGEYSIEAQLSGFATTTQGGIVVPVGTVVLVNITLQLAGVEEQITVRAATPVVRTRESSLGVDINNNVIDNTPLKGREFLDLLTLVPGVATRPPTSDQGANITVFGERSITSSFLIDGQSNDDMYSRSAAEFFVQDAIQEFKVYLTGYPAEFGRASGAVANVVTKSGTNDLSGRAFFFVRDDALNSSNIEGQDPQQLNRIETGGTIGGPILQNKSFYFGAFQFVKEERGLNFDQSILNPIVSSGFFSPAAGGAEPFDSSPEDTRYTTFLKWDTQINSKNTLFVTANFNRLDRSNFVPKPEESFGSPPPGTVALPSTASDREQDTTSVSARHTGFFNDSAFLESSFRVWRSNFEENTQKPQGAEQLFPITFAPSFQIWQSNASAVGVIDREQERFQWVEHLSYFTEAKGTHALKFGVDLDRIQLTQDLTPPRGIIVGNSALDSGFETLGYDISMQRFVSPIVSNNQTSDATTNNWAIFGQDAWEVSPGVSLNLGLRWDYASLFGDDKNNVAPRFGISWDITGEQKTILRAGYGRFYDVSILETAIQTPELGGIQFGVLDLQIMPRGGSFYNNPGIGAFGPLQDSGTRWLGNPTLFEYIIPEGDTRTSAGTFQIQRDGQVVTDNTIVGKGNPYIVYDVLGIPVADPSNPPVLTYENIAGLTGGMTPEAALAALNTFFPNPSGAGPQFDFLEDQGENSVINGRPLIYKFRQLEPQVDVIQTIQRPHALPYTDAVNFGVEQAITDDLAIDAEFHIRRSRDLVTRRVVNLLALPIAASCRGNTLDGGPCERQLENLGFLDTEALTLALKKRFRQNYSFLASYTFTDAEDNFSTLRVPPRGGETSFLFNNMPELDNGRSLNTPKHVFVFSGVYNLPFEIPLSGVLRWQSGQPFNAAGLPLDSDGDNIFDNRLLGTEKGEFLGPRFFQLDVRFAKVIRVRDVSFTLLAEIFNLTNEQNPEVINRTCGDSTGDGLPDAGGCTGVDFGGVVRALPGREAQFAIKFDF